jgi:Secretion system C-terminal sorting domain
MTKSFFLSCCFLIATTSALAQQFPMDQFMGVNLRREDPVERLNCVGFVREYHDWAIDENNSYNFRRVDSLAFPNNLYSWNLQQSTSVKFDNFYSDMLFHLNHQPGTRPPICATMKQCLPYLAGGDTYGTYSELKPVKYDSSGRRKRDQYPQNDKPLNYTPVLGWGNTASYTWIADWLYQFTRRYGANVSPLSNIPKPQTGEVDRKGLNMVGYVELWNEPNKYWIKNYGDATDVSWLRATQFTGGEYAAMASTSYDAHRTTIDLTDSVTRLHYKPGVRSADNSMKFVMGGSAGIREYDWRFLQDMKTWFDNNRIDTGLRTKYPFDVINFHHYNSNRWFGLVGQVGLNDYAASPEEDRWRLGSREVNYDAATTATGTAFEQEDSIRHYDMVNPVNSSTRTFKQRLVELRYRVDSLFGRRPVELWMSEFGFDTNEKSPYKVPTIYHPNGSGAVLIDQQEMQARFIVRTYLEIAAAKWDRAMQYDFRDEVSYNGSLFQASGLLRDRANNYTPKKSYYYVHTMKEALKGTKFRNEIKVGNDPTFTTDPIFGGHSYWYKDTSYHRLMRFTKNNPSVTNGGDIVYVAWLPTKTNAIKQDSVKIYLQPSDNAATLATIVSMSVGDINGLRKPFILREDAVGKYMVLKLTETPVFIRLGESYLDADANAPRAANSYGISCDAIRVQLSAGSVPTNGFVRAYYYERPKSEAAYAPTTLDIANPFTKLYADTIKCDEFVLTGLKLPHNEYKIYVEAVDANNTVSPAITITASTTTCFNNYVPVTKMSSNKESVKVQLFNYDTLDFCYPLRRKEGNFNHLGSWTTFSPDSVDITLDTIYQLDAISILEGSGVGSFDIKVLNPTTDSILKVIPYAKMAYDEWKTVPLCDVKAKKLRFVKSANAQMRKIILKGKAVDANYVIACCGSNDSLLGATVKRVTSTSNLSTVFGNAVNGFQGVVRVENCTLIADKVFTFGQGTKIYMSGPNAAIFVKKTNLDGLKIESTNIRGCDNLWQGITLDTGAVLRVSNSAIRDAAIGIKLLRTNLPIAPKTQVMLSHSVFEDNHVGLSTWRPETYNYRDDVNSISNIWNCTFDGNFRDLKVPQSDFDRRRSFTGLDLHYVNPTFGGGSVPNLFNDLAEGVKSNYSIVTLNNPIFKNIQPKKQLSYTSTATVAPMGGIAVSTTNGSLTFNGSGRDVPIFENVYNGFYCHYSDFNISNGHFVTEGNYALQSYYGRGGSAIFDNNRVITLEGGALGIWKGSGTIALLNNNIDCGASNRSVAAVAVGSYFHRDISLTSPINTSIEMHSDTIRGTGGVRSTILAVDMAEDVMVRRNLLKFNAYSSADATPSWGIKMDLVERSDIRWNDIIGIKNLNDDYRYSPAQVGILSSNSRNNAIQCDSIANAKISLQFQYNNTSIRNNSAGEVAGNKLSGYNIGLKVDSFAIVGIQSHRRNRWTRPAPNHYQADAILDDPDASLDRRRDNRFKVESNYSLSNVQPTDWFLVEGASNPFTCDTVPGRANGNNGSTGGVYEAVIAGHYEAPAAYLWMLEKQAYEDFSALPASIQTTAMQTFLTSKQGTEIEIFYQLKKGFERLFQQDESHATRLKQLSQWMNDWAKKKQLADNQWIAEDAVVGEWNKEYVDLSEIEQQNTITKAIALRQLNGTLPEDDFTIRSKMVNTNQQRPYIFYEKVVNDLYLSKIIEGTVIYTEKEAEILKKIAMMCPLVAAEAPMKARIIYQHFVNPVALPAADCSNVPNAVQKSIEKPHFKVYPNPTNNQFTLISEEGIKAFNWSLFTATGVMVKEGKSRSFSETIDTQDLTNGVYFICIKEKNVITATLKVVVLK